MEQFLVEGVTQEMQDIVDAKFAKWDKVVGDNILEVGTEQEQASVYQLLKDCIPEGPTRFERTTKIICISRYDNK